MEQDSTPLYRSVGMNARKNTAIGFLQCNTLYLFGENERVIACPSNRSPTQEENLSCHQKEARPHSTCGGISEIHRK